MSGVAVIGAGKWGKNHVRTFFELGALEAVVDCDTDRCKEVSSKYPGLKVYTSLEPILNSPEIKGVSIATPSETHYDISKKCVEACKDVLVEKPMTLNIRDAEHLLSITKTNGTILMVGHVVLFNPAIDKIKKIIEQGHIGTIQHIYSSRLNFGIIRSHENVLWSCGPHDIALISHILDREPKVVYAKGVDYYQEGIHDIVCLHLEFESKINAQIDIGWLFPHKETRLIIIGDKGILKFIDENEYGSLEIYDNKVQFEDDKLTAVKNGSIEIPFEWEPPLTVECSHFVNCIKNRVNPITNGENGLIVIKTLEKAQKMLDKGI